MKSEVIEEYKTEKKEIYNKKFGVIFDGDDNLKSLVVENLIDGSPTASQCAWIYERFIGGAGFEVDLSKVNISGDPHNPMNPNDLVFDSSEVLARHRGFYIHVAYNANYQKEGYKIIPYTLCKVGEKDSQDYFGKILMSAKGWGKSLKKEEVQVFDVYNPRPEVIQAQVDRDGGWENYKGQIYYFKLSNKYTYSKSFIETAYLFADTEIQLGFFYNGTAKRGFEDLTFIRHRKFENDTDKTDFYDNLKKVSGFKNTGSKMVLQDDWDDEREKSGNFKFDTLKNDVKAEKYAHFEVSSSNFIRKAFNIPPQMIDFVAGKLGNTSGDDLKMAQSIYNSIISRDQEKVEMLFKELFSNYKENINPTGNWTIKQYSLLDDGTVNYDVNNPIQSEEELSKKAIRDAQAVIRGSVGGVTSLLAIQLSVSQQTTSFDAGVAMLENIFGYATPVAIRILGAPVINEKTPQDAAIINK